MGLTQPSRGLEDRTGEPECYAIAMFAQLHANGPASAKLLPSATVMHGYPLKVARVGVSDEELRPLP